MLQKRIAMKKIFASILFFLAVVGVMATPAPRKKINLKYYDKVEPASWWAGMKNQELMLTFSGENVSRYELLSDSPEFRIIRTELVENPDYMFAYIDISEAEPGVYALYLRGPRGLQRIDYELKEREEGSAERESFGSQDAVYLIMPDRFANGNLKNDKVEGYVESTDLSSLQKRQGGDIQGIINHLDYISDLGITAIWTTPLLDDNDDKYSYHHYATTDIYKVDPRFGTNDDFRRLVDECHAHGLKYIMDIVPNHLNVRYWSEVPDSSWLNRWDTFTRTNYQLSVQTDPHASQADKLLLEKGWFDTNMADLNLNNQLLFDYLRQAYIYWIEFTGLDGLRVDTYPYNDLDAVSRLMRSIRDEYPNLNIVGECWVKSVPEMAYYQSGNNNKDGFDSGMPSVMDFILKDYLEWVFNEEESWNSGLIRFYSHFAQDFALANPNLVMNMLDNHDMSRYSNAVKRDPKLYRMGLALLAVVRGFPQYYYGDEIMIDCGPGSYEDVRYRFPGGWNDDIRSAFTPETRSFVENGIYNYLKSILQFRKTSDALKYGKMMQFIPQNSVYCMFRYTDNQKVMVVVNNNDYVREVDITRFNEMDCVGAKVENIVSGEIKILSEKETFPGKTVTIFNFIE